MGKTLQVILVNDVPNLGKSSEVKTVSSGYARNFLFPKHWAVPATPKAVEEAKERLARKVAEEEKRREAMKETLTTLGKLVVTLQANASSDGTLFAGIHAKEIATALQTQGMQDITEAMILLSSPIKKVGSHSFELMVDRDTRVTGTVQVEPASSTTTNA